MADLESSPCFNFTEQIISLFDLHVSKGFTTRLVNKLTIILMEEAEANFQTYRPLSALPSGIASSNLSRRTFFSPT